jgi:hypothetical protein
MHDKLLSDAPSVPRVLYKYVRPERIDAVQLKKLRFTQPTATNDLFDLKPVFESLVPEDEFETLMRPTESMFEGAMRRQYEALPPETRAQLTFEDLMALADSRPDLVEESYRQVMPHFKTFIKDFTPQLRQMMIDAFSRMIGILSLTETPTNQVMWAHYAHNHQGLVLAFDTTNGFFNRRCSANDEFHHLRQVRYVDRKADGVSLVRMSGNDVFFTKTSGWAYEQEWRMIAPLGSDLNHPPGDDEIVLFDFPASALLEVIFGARAGDGLRAGLRSIIESDSQLAHVGLREVFASERGSTMEIRDCVS